MRTVFSSSLWAGLLIGQTVQAADVDVDQGNRTVTS